jgi:ATP-binding cassette subfamily G (WHITE) protein 2 (PDR)
MSSPWGAIPQAEGVVGGLVSGGRRNTQDRMSEQPAALLPSSDEDEDTDGEKGEAVTQLARTFTQRSVKTKDGHYVNPFENSDDPLLNPHSGSFSQRAWIKTLIGIASRDPERYPMRVAGVSYKNLNVHGFGQSTDFQKTFGNYPLSITSLFDKFRGDKGKTKIQILRNFDGLVKSGEMLVVLGRPGRQVTSPPRILQC